MKKHVLLVIPLMLGATLAFSQPIVRVWGTEDSIALKEQVIQYLAYLDVQEDVYVLVNINRRMPEKLEGITHPLLTPANHAGQVIKVRINASLSKRKQRLVLAHEMVHVKQYAKEELRAIDKQWVLWKGRKYFYRGTMRSSSPWEREAYRMDRLVAEAADKPTTTPSSDRLIAKRTRP